MDISLAIFKLNRVIAICYIKNNEIDKAIKILASYVDRLLQMKADGVEIDDEIKIVKELMLNYLHDKDSEEEHKKGFVFGFTEDEEIKYQTDLFLHYRDVLSNRPDDKYTIKACINELLKIKIFDVALPFTQYIDFLEPNNFDCLHNLGCIYNKLKEYEISIEYFKRALEIKDMPFIYNDLGVSYSNLSSDENPNKEVLEIAYNYFKKAFELNPYDRCVLHNYIRVCQNLKKTDMQKKLYKFLMNNNPTILEYTEYSNFCLSIGDIEEYKKYVDYRLKNKRYFTKYVSHEKMNKFWDCKEDISDKILLVISEQGYGDNFMYCRCLHEAIQKAKKVKFIVPKEVISLLKYNFPEVEFYPRTGILFEEIEYDYYVPIMSLIKLWDLSKPQTSYLKVDNEKVRKFKRLYINQTKFNVGILYESKSENFFAKTRNVNLELFKILSSIKDIQLYSFSLDTRNYPKEKEMRIQSLGKYIEDFEDTAAGLKNMHLVITTDSVILNLAGALGVKTYGLFNYKQEHRWYKTTGEDVGWYKSVKPFQAKKQNAWESLMAEVKNEVENYRIELRENYMNLCLKQIMENENLSEKSKLVDKGYIYMQLLFTTYKDEYIQKSIETHKESIRLDNKDYSALGNLATDYGFFTDKIEASKRIWDKILPYIQDNNNLLS